MLCMPTLEPIIDLRDFGLIRGSLPRWTAGAEMATGWFSWFGEGR
jgi:hypothetical protein